MKYLSHLSDLPEFTGAQLDPEQLYIPKPIMEHPQFRTLKSDGKMLYSFILNRLREPVDFGNKGYDENGDTFVLFPVKEGCQLLNKSKTTVIALKKKLRDYQLIEEVQIGKNEPNHIYLTDELVKYYN